mgnify:FL=1
MMCPPAHPGPPLSPAVDARSTGREARPKGVDMRSACCAMVACLAVFAGGCSSSAGPDGESGDDVSPLVWISHPPSNAVIGDEVTIVADATDSRSVSRVEFVVDGDTVSTDFTSPYEFTWDASGQPTASVHLISAVAWDLAGNRGESHHLPVHCRWRRLIRDGDEMWLGDIDFVYVRSTPTMLEFRGAINGYWTDPHDPDEGIDIGILLDVDQDQSTGLNEYTPGWYAPNDIGADYGAGVGREGDGLWVWNEADTLWSVHGDFAYISLPGPGSQFDVGIYRSDIGDPSTIDIVAVGVVRAGAFAHFDWAPDAEHATYHVDGLYLGGAVAPPLSRTGVLPVVEAQGGSLWQRTSSGH